MPNFSLVELMHFPLQIAGYFLFVPIYNLIKKKN